MKPQKLIDLKRERLTLMDEARSILAAMDGENDERKLRELGAKHDKAMRALDANALDIDEARSEAEDEAELAAQRPNLGGSGVAYGSDHGANDFARAWAGDNQSGWADSNGKAVRVLDKSERLSKPEDRDFRGVSLGDAVRAMATGARTELERRALSEGTNSAGGYTVPTPLASWFIDRLRMQSVAIQAGARTIPMDSETLKIARLETDPTIGWRAENADLAEGDPTFGAVTLTAKSLAGIVKFSRELLMDTANAGAMIEQALASTMALEIDRAAIWGSGTSPEPEGVANVTGINTVSMGTNGAAISSYDKMLDALYELALDNVPNVTAAIMHPRTATAVAKLKDGDGNPLTVPAPLTRFPVLQTTAAPIDETQGTATNASSIVFGNFAELFIGMRESINIQVLDQRYAEKGQIALAVHARMDAQLAHPASFCALQGVIPA